MVRPVRQGALGLVLSISRQMESIGATTPSARFRTSFDHRCGVGLVMVLFTCRHLVLEKVVCKPNKYPKPIPRRHKDTKKQWRPHAQKPIDGNDAIDVSDLSRLRSWGCQSPPLSP